MSRTYDVRGFRAPDRRVAGDGKHVPEPHVMSALLAHQGGWDEILLVAGPIAVVVGLLAVVRRRVNARVDSRVDTPVERDRPD